MKKKGSSKMRYIVGVDEAGEKAWDAFARGCLLFRSMRNSDNLYSSCKEDGLQN